MLVRISQESVCALAYRNCQEIYDEDSTSATGVYALETGKHFCYIDSNARSCGGGAWTLALKVDGTKVNFDKPSRINFDIEAILLESLYFTFPSILR